MNSSMTCSLARLRLTGRKPAPRDLRRLCLVAVARDRLALSRNTARCLLGPPPIPPGPLRSLATRTHFSHKPTAAPDLACDPPLVPLIAIWIRNAHNARLPHADRCRCACTIASRRSLAGTHSHTPTPHQNTTTPAADTTLTNSPLCRPLTSPSQPSRTRSTASRRHGTDIGTPHPRMPPTPMNCTALTQAPRAPDPRC